MHAHDAMVESVIRGAPSHYRADLARKIVEGRDRTLLRSHGHALPGYYGPRGQLRICEAIMARFTPLLKECAGGDRVMAARGVVGFVMAVLVMEVATRLIVEDLRLGGGKGTEEEEEALSEGRRVLEESARFGELLNDEVGEEVAWGERADEDRRTEGDGEEKREGEEQGQQEGVVDETEEEGEEEEVELL